MIKFFGTLAFLFVLTILPVPHMAHAGGDVSITAEQLAAHGPWHLKATMSNNKTYWGDITFEASGEEITKISIAWDDGTTNEARVLVFDGVKLHFEHELEQSCGARLLTYKLEIEQDAKGGLVFTGKTTGPSSNCRSGTFKDQNVMTPKTPVTS